MYYDCEKRGEGIFIGTETILKILEIVGTVAFTVSGAMVAIKKGVDLFGVLFLGVITAVGGGVLRDVIISRLPPGIFIDYGNVVIAIATALFVFSFARVKKDKYTSHEALYEQVNNVFDAAGLGAFSVTGVMVCTAAGYGDNGFLCLASGLITGIGGGLMRDVMLKEIPFVLKKRVYAVASLIGSLAYFLLMQAGVPELWSMLVGVCAVFVLRMLATIFRWNLPKAL